ncbi:hypothetical protein H5410_041652 [Solanum commersonii]|uniref:Diacylglycerol glucosyltransferase N-terminal domain-containing protein n=1 Tax=Solanum commersonii TaxID=4109 RepID=A0A9J5XTP9_SOLCO|nr:hypothetical protein H5410_041652 [Solanum commersonii]
MYQIIMKVAKDLMKYQSDIIIRVHPLMQHVSLRLLRSKGLLKKIYIYYCCNRFMYLSSNMVYLTHILIDLCPRHQTLYILHVFTKFARGALKAGLQPAQIKDFGLPVRPSFVKPVCPKENKPKK